MLNNLMFNTGTVEMPVYEKDTSGAEVITDWVEWDYGDLPCNVQPASAAEVQFYFERGMEVSHNIFTNFITTYQRNWKVTVEGQEYHIVGVRDFITLHRCIELNCMNYPSDAKKR